MPGFPCDHLLAAVLEQRAHVGPVEIFPVLHVEIGADIGKVEIGAVACG